MLALHFFLNANASAKWLSKERQRLRQSMLGALFGF